MQEPTFLILTALAEGAQHGYGIIADVERISAGRTRMRAGTLYAALDRLQAENLIAADREEVVDGRLRRYYRLTEDGAAALAAEVEALRRRTEVAARRLAARPNLGATAAALRSASSALFAPPPAGRPSGEPC
ncbi:PadR family transcriptional regulator [Actinomadura logoneensis]|uniref:PadR family transcriptional regulator n=1 Tax=Actinomadura logoneensis TaxID=2293572 RepID=A0A372JUA8_9ACTN|nr:PadR family transcriptional regulator [Actinomadura logoneensis]RFU43386.1 PadR family transcriptional regulator [Actinomadura logoneensis]